MNYAVVLSARARRDLMALPREITARIDPRIASLAEDPRPPGCKKLTTVVDDAWRIRIGDYRVLYRIDDRARRVLVYHVGHRRDVYD
ncbi:MAG: type II toxin-antitoxin system RelE/ParE family toxin [Phycisphaerales bacterium]|nr:type II toxin-antitoxin system RelE/ParE family toxin [Phycisphaerales bacterium]